MDPLALAFIAVEAIAIAILAALAIGRGRQLDEIGEVAAGRTTGGRPDEPVEGPAVAVRRLRERAGQLAWELDQERRDAEYLADLIGVGIVHLDDELQVDLANAAAHVFLDRAPGTMRGRTAMEAFVDGRIEEIAAAARERGSATGELTVREPDGPTLVVRARRSPVRGVWLVLEDVAELRRLQRIRSEFIDNLSHELRTPLTTVGLLAEGLSRDADAAGEAVPARMRERIAKIEIETGHLTQMVTELLDLSQIESGGGQLHLDDVDLAELAASSAERLRLFAERQGIRLRADVPATVPAVRGDADRLGQVFVNLVHNAIKFSPAGSEVVVRVRGTDGEVMASVEDRGIGIARSDQARIFERFYKVDRARRRGGGTGLGLSIARHVIQGHGGRLWVESEEGKGSTFTFALPVAPPVPRSEPPRTNGQPAAPDSGPIRARL